MTVKELIALLTELDENKTIGIYTYDEELDSWGETISDVITENPKYGDKFYYYLT